MVYSLGKMDAAFSMMQTANSQLSSIQSAGPDSDIKQLHELDKKNAMQMIQDQTKYQIMEKMEEQDKKIKEDKIKRSFSYFD